MKKQSKTLVCRRWQGYFAVALLCASLTFSSTAHAATFTVTKTADTNDGACNTDCSLREAITAANASVGNDTIAVAAGLNGSVLLNSTLPVVSGNLTINGPGAASFVVTRNAASGSFRIFAMAPGSTFSLGGLTVSNGAASKGAGINNDGGTLNVTRCILQDNIAADEGGAIHNNALNAPVTATITDTTFKNNQAISNSGGGLFNDARGSAASATVKGCTFVGNQASRGGGVFNYGPSNAATLNLTNCTLSANQATNDGGAVTNDSGFVSGNAVTTLSDCTLADNVAAGGGAISSVAGGTVHLSNTIFNNNSLIVDSFGGTIISDGYNLSSDSGAGFLTASGDQINTNPQLGPLQNNGGPTLTYALLTGSPAIDKGKSLGVTTDQRGFNRPVNNVSIAPATGGDNSDIGAFEVGGVPALSVNNPRSLPEGSAAAPGSVTFDITLNAASTQAINVNYQTTNGTNNPAIAGVDYIAKKGKLTFAPGETNKRVTISFIGDSAVELNETFFFDLLTPTNATIADNRGVGQINNDDGPGITIDNAPAVTEPSSGTIAQTFTIHLSAASTDTITVDYETANGTAIAGSDYVATSGTLTFTPGQTSKTVMVLVQGDAITEPTETYKVVLSKVTRAYIADGTGIGTIRNNASTLQIFEDEPSS